MLDFLDFTFLDVLDILLVATLLYYIYKLLKGTVAINIFIGIALVVLIWKITQALQMEMLSSLLGALISLGAIAILIVFQPEVRKFLLMIGSTNFANKKNFLKQLLQLYMFRLREQLLPKLKLHLGLVMCLIHLSSQFQIFESCLY